MNNEFIGKEKEALMDMIGSTVAELNRTVFTSGTLRVRLYEDIMPKFTKELAVLLSITNCDQSKNIEMKTQEKQVIHLGITDIRCSRIKGESSLSVPIVNSENSIIQVFKGIVYGSQNDKTFHFINSTLRPRKLWSIFWRILLPSCGFYVVK